MVISIHLDLLLGFLNVVVIINSFVSLINAVKLHLVTNYDYIKLELSKLLVEKITIIAKKHPNIYILNALLKISIGLFYIYTFYIEYKTIIRCINFIISMFFFDISNLDITNLDFVTCVLLLDNFCLFYTLYIKYINPSFEHKYPKINKFIDYICNLLFLFNIFKSIYTVLIRPSSGSGMGSSGSGMGSGGSGNNGGKPPKGPTNIPLDIIKENEKMKRKIKQRLKYFDRQAEVLVNELKSCHARFDKNQISNTD